MQKTDFTAQSPGRPVKAEAGVWAFAPGPLPPPFELGPDLIELLSEADAALGTLQGIGERLPNPYLLIVPYMRREAILSSRIEGTQSTLSELFAFEVEPDEPPRHDVREVSNYVQAMEKGLVDLNALPLSLRFVRNLHATLMAGVRGEDQTPGQFRRHQNYIGAPGTAIQEATYVPPPVPDMTQALHAWELFLHERRGVPPLVQCAMLHYQFEAIHPFADGNGRVGRLLITLFLCERERLTKPLLYLSGFFERNRDEYYRRLLAVTREGDWPGWIGFFLRGVAAQARAAVEHSAHVLDLHESYRRRLQSARATAFTLMTLDRLFRNPYVTARAVVEATKTTTPTAQNIINRLVKANILEETTGKKWRRIYCARELLRTLDDPPTDAH